MGGILHMDALEGQGQASSQAERELCGAFMALPISGMAAFAYSGAGMSLLRIRAACAPIGYSLESVGFWKSVMKWQ